MWSTDSSSWISHNSSTKSTKVRNRQRGAVWLQTGILPGWKTYNKMPWEYLDTKAVQMCGYVSLKDSLEEVLSVNIYFTRQKLLSSLILEWTISLFLPLGQTS